jgi:pantothenate kinase type III
VPGEPAVFLTGGAGPVVAALLGPAARHIPHLTLAGIALAEPAGA